MEFFRAGSNFRNLETDNLPSYTKQVMKIPISRVISHSIASDFESEGLLIDQTERPSKA